MKMLRSILLFAALGLGASALAQSASLSANDRSLSRQGGTMTLTATVAYAGQPGALGWSIVLPSDWTLERIAGPNLPQVAPDTGATGTLEFAYTAVPPQSATFSVTVGYPPNTSRATVNATVIVRENGNVRMLTTNTLAFEPRKVHRNARKEEE